MAVGYRLSAPDRPAAQEAADADRRAATRRNDAVRGRHGARPTPQRPIARAVATLDPDVRTVFLAANLDGLTTKEIAVLHQMPQGTVKTRMARARAQLKAELGPDPHRREDVA